MAAMSELGALYRGKKLLCVAGLLIVCMGCEANVNDERAGVPATHTVRDSTYVVAMPVSSELAPMQQEVSATMDHSTLKLFVTVTNTSTTDLIVCPSYVVIDRGPSATMFAEQGFGSSFDVEPPGMKPPENYHHEPGPHATRLQAQFVLLPAREKLTVQYEYQHNQPRHSISSRRWHLFGELGLPAWYRTDSLASTVLNRVRYGTPKPHIVMRERQTSLETDHVWWVVDGDSTFVSLSSEEQQLLLTRTVNGRILRRQRVAITLQETRFR